MNNERKYFGTDGIRGRVGEELLTPLFVQELGRAIGTVFNGKRQILIARDPRISGDMLQAALSSGICSTGVSVCDLGILPTPACAYITKYLQADAGVVISASHNPYHDNGLKFFNTTGSKLSDQQEISIENVLSTNQQNRSGLISPNRIGKISSDNQLADLYINYCLDIVKKVNTSQSLEHLKTLKIIVDCSNGAMYKIAPQVFSKMGLDITVINSEPNGFNINQECGSACQKGLAALARLVKKNNADLAIAFDGDGDRLIMINAKGEIIDGDEILYILACEKLRTGQPLPGLVGTLMSNLGLEKAMQDRGVEFIRSKVGDRYVLEKLLEKNWMLGGETSGHILSLDQSTTGDGLVAALLILSTIGKTEQSLESLVKDFHKYPQAMVNVALSNDVEKDIDEVLNRPIIKSAIGDIEKILNHKGRLLIRKSGTEPLIRIMVEGERLSEVEKLANELASLIKTEYGRL